MSGPQTPRRPAALDELEGALGGRISRTRVMLAKGQILRWKLHTEYEGHQIDLLANENLLLLEVVARYGKFELMEINPPDSPRYYSEIAATVRCGTGVEHRVYICQEALSQAQSELLRSGALERLLETVAPGREEVYISQRLVQVLIDNPTAQRVMTIIDAVIRSMPHEPEERVPAGDFPYALRPLIPLAEKWAISDDEERSRKLRRCAPSTRRKLVNAVKPLMPAINQFLDSFGKDPPEEACALGDFAQAAMEAESFLKGEIP